MAEKLLIQDLIGTTYEKLTIIEEGKQHQEPNGKKQRVMICQCSCGGTTKKLLKDLRSGMAKSCGCLHNEKKLSIKKGDKYNYWTIVREVDNYISPSGDASRKVLVKCICGKERDIILNSLVRNQSRSCGCKIEHIGKKGKRLNIDSPIKPLIIEDINKQDFGDWIIVEEISAKRNEKAEIERTIKMQCKCGTTKECSLNNAKISQSCLNCATKRRGKDSEYNEFKVKIINRFNMIKNRCYKETNKDYKSYGAKGIKIDNEWLEDKNKFVQWCIEQGMTKENRKDLELDRKDNLGDYSASNCQLISKIDNVLKQLGLTTEDVRYIRSSSFDWGKDRKKYKCSDLTLNNIINYKTFKDVI